MTLNAEQQELKNVALQLIEAACNYRLDDLEKLYSPELTVVMVQPDGSSMKLDYAGVMGLFRERRDSDAPALEKTAEFNHIEMDGQFGYIIVTRYMDLLGDGPKKIVFSLILKKSGDSWQIYREHAVIAS